MKGLGETPDHEGKRSNPSEAGTTEDRFLMGEKMGGIVRGVGAVLMGQGELKKPNEEERRVLFDCIQEVNDLRSEVISGADAARVRQIKDRLFEMRAGLAGYLSPTQYKQYLGTDKF